MTRWRLIKTILAVSAVAIVGLSVAAGIAASRDGGPDDDAAPPRGDDSATAWLGVLAETSEYPEGARIVRVVDDSPAAEAGIEEDDVITAVDGDGISSDEPLRDAIRKHAPGDEITLSVIKSGEDSETSVNVTLGERPAFKRGFGKFGLDGLGDLIPGFNRLLDGSFRYLDEDGNVVEVAAVAGTVTDISDSELTIETNEGDSRSFDLSEDAGVPGGLEAGDEVIVASVDGEVKAVIAPGHFPGIPLPHFDLEGNGLPFCDEDFDAGPHFDDLRDAMCDGEFEFPGFHMPGPCDPGWLGSIPYGACGTPTPTPTPGA